MTSQNQNKEITVSVVIAARNEALHVKEALTSVLAQRDVNLELIFVDDNSTDSTFQIASQVANEVSNLRVIRNLKAGKCSAFNLGVASARGDYVCIFAGDDNMPQGSLRERLDAVLTLGEQENAISLGKIRAMSEIKKYDGMVVPRRKGHSSLSGVSPFMHKTAARRIFPVPETLPNEDTWMELAILYLPGIRVVQTDIIVCNWRVHEGNSINMLADFATYNKKISLRMTALTLFYECHKNELLPDKLERLYNRVHCEAHRVAGSVFGVMTSNSSFKDRLRALSSTNSFFYWMRSSFFRLFSGW